MPERLAERVWCPKSQSSLLNIYFRLKWVPVLASAYFRDGSNRCSHCSKICYPTCDSPLKNSAQKIAPIQPFLCVNRSPIQYDWRRKSYPVCDGNRTEWSPIRSVIIRVINKIGRPGSGSPICLNFVLLAVEKISHLSARLMARTVQLLRYDAYCPIKLSN